jgi:hypothetical protein
MHAHSFAAQIGPATLTVGGHVVETFDLTGGGVFAEVVKEYAGPGFYRKKHPGPPRYETVRFGVSRASPPLAAFVTASLAAVYPRLDGSVSAGPNSFEIDRALLARVAFPGVDATAPRAPARMELWLAPTATRPAAPRDPEPADRATSSDEPAVTDRFRLVLDGIDATGVVKIAPIVVKLWPVTDDPDDDRDYAGEPGKIEFPEIVFHVPESSGQPFREWLRAFVLRHECDEQHLKTGFVEYLSARGDVVMRLALEGVGVVAADPAVLQGQRCVRVEVFVESIAPEIL